MELGICIFIYQCMFQEEATSSTSQVMGMLQPYIDMAKERVTEPLVEDPNTDKAIKGKAIITCTEVEVQSTMMV